MGEEEDLALDGRSACKSALLHPSLLICCLWGTKDYRYNGLSLEMNAIINCSASYRQRENIHIN